MKRLSRPTLAPCPTLALYLALALRLALALCLTLVALLVPGGSASAQPTFGPTPGPRLAFVRIAGHGVNLETTDEFGGSPRLLTRSHGKGQVRPFFLSPPSWSSDSRSLLFTGGLSGGKEEFDPGSIGVYSVSVEGGTPTPIPYTTNALFPVALPGGTTAVVVKSRGQDSEVVSNNHVIHRSRSRTSLWIISLVGGPPRQLTPWRADLVEFPDSATPDGRYLVITRHVIDPQPKQPPLSRSSVALLDLASGKIHPLGADVAGVAYSPDGSRRAVVREKLFPHHTSARPRGRRRPSTARRTSMSKIWPTAW